MSYATLRDELRYYIHAIYKYEHEFINNFFVYISNDIEIHECYFASDRVRIVLNNNNTGTQLTTTLSTESICDWVDAMEKENEPTLH